jgi:hypothetical protein
VLTDNLSVKHKLANGTKGTIVAILSDKPSCKGSVCLVSVEGVHVPGVELGLVPISLCTENRGYSSDGHIVKETFLPLKLGYATSIHKSQGKSESAVQFYLDKCEYFSGQTYTQLSRVSSLNDFMIIDENLKFSRFDNRRFLRGLEVEHSEAVRLGVFEELFG